MLREFRSVRLRRVRLSLKGSTGKICKGKNNLRTCLLHRQPPAASAASPTCHATGSAAPVFSACTHPTGGTPGPNSPFRCRAHVTVRKSSDVKPHHTACTPQTPRTWERNGAQETVESSEREQTNHINSSKIPPPFLFSFLALAGRQVR
jgi:hypothetical protein